MIWMLGTATEHAWNESHKFPKSCTPYAKQPNKYCHIYQCSTTHYCSLFLMHSFSSNKILNSDYLSIEQTNPLFLPNTDFDLQWGLAQGLVSKFNFCKLEILYTDTLTAKITCCAERGDGWPHTDLNTCTLHHLVVRLTNSFTVVTCVISQDSKLHCSREGKGAWWWMCNGRVLPLYVVSYLYSSFRVHCKYWIHSHIYYYITLVFYVLQIKVIILYSYWNGPLIASNFLFLQFC